MLKRSVGFLFALSAFAGAAVAGEFSVKAISPSLIWTPSDCPMPRKRHFHVEDVNSYNAAVEEYNNYLHQVRTYRSCINDEAQKDAEAAAAAIAKGLEQANDKARRELDSARSGLESAKRLLQ